MDIEQRENGGDKHREREREVLIMTKLIDREMDKQKVNQAVREREVVYVCV